MMTFGRGSSGTPTKASCSHACSSRRSRKNRTTGLAVPTMGDGSFARKVLIFHLVDRIEDIEGPLVVRHDEYGSALLVRDAGE
jgi:hypothetical protein